MEHRGLGLLAALILALGGGCKQSASESDHHSSVLVTNQPPLTIARVHWLGLKRIAADTNAARFMSLWDLPESVRLEAQTLDKLALAIVGDRAAVASLSGTSNQSPADASQKAESRGQKAEGTNQTPELANHKSPSANHNAEMANRKSQLANPKAARLRLLLDHLVQDEWYVEMQQVTNQSPELALAVRLDDQRAELWTSNLTAVLGSMTNVQSLPAQTDRHAWHLPLAAGPAPGPSRPSRLELARAGDWTLVGLALERNTPLDNFAARIRRDHTPVPGADPGSSLEMDPATRKMHPPTGAQIPTFWLEAAVNLRRISSALSLGGQRPGTLPKAFLAVAGDQTNVHTRVDLDFPEPLPLEIEAWNIPTNLIHDPLIGFAAVRGIRPWLESFKPWKELQLGTPPNQAFFWAQGGAPFLHFLAAPSAAASNQVNKLSELVLRDLNPILATNGWPRSAFGRRTNSPGLVWRGVPYFSPDLDYADCRSSRFLFAGLAPDQLTNRPAPAGLFHYLEASPELVAYDWENTRPCLDGWTQMGQLARHMLCRARMPYTAGLAWLTALSPKLGNSITTVELTSPTQLCFVRSSTVGFTGAELQLLADWLESLEFPCGLHTFTAPVPPPMIPLTNAPPPIQGTNAVAPKR